MTQVKLNDLKKTVKEINAMEIFPEMDPKAKREELEDFVKEAVSGEEPLEADEVAELSEVAQSVIKALKEGVNDEEEKDTDDEEEGADEDSEEEESTAENTAGDEDDDRTLEEIVEDTDDLDELKAIIKEDDTFKKLRKGLGIQKKADKLKERMLDVLTELKTVPQGDKGGKAVKEEKPAKKETAKKETKKETAKKESGELSNKAKVYLAWDKGEEDPENLFKLVDDRVQLKTIKLWINSWKNGKNLPAIAKKK